MDMSVWYLLGAVLVFFMQCGFAMVETGFTRAKNAGNIIMKNLMDFCIGTVVFFVLGYGIMNSENYFFGLIGRPEYQMFTDFANFDWSNFFFQLVFCATAATIVSGAMAERTKFSTYCIYSAVISAIVYPIEAGWVWNSAGWLAKLGYVDFAGSSVIHMVGGIASVIGAAMLGPRIGKYTKGKDGKVVVNAFPGHSLTLGALGCFILWFAWYGFNGAAASDPTQLAQILGTTTIAPAVATFACMLFTWIRNGAPDVSMCLNASLAGLVAVTAGCDVVDAFGSIVIGAVSGLLVVFGVWFCDNKIHVDDPVGAVAVHMMNGIWGTIAVGLFATKSAPAFARGYGDGVTYGANQIAGAGLFYGGGFSQLGLQLLGMLCTAAFTAVTITITFLVIKAIFGLRVSEEEEIIGLDATEHGLPSAYAGFSIMDIDNTMTMEQNANTNLGVEEYERASAAQKAAAVKVVKAPDVSPSGIYKVVIIAKLSRYDKLRKAMNDIGVTGMTVTQVMGCGIQKGAGEKYRGVELDATLLPKVKVEVVVSSIPVDTVIAAAKKTLYTGHIGDGKIFVYNVDRVVKVRTGEENFAALQDVE